MKPSSPHISELTHIQRAQDVILFSNDKQYFWLAFNRVLIQEILLWPSERKNLNWIKWHLKFWKSLWCDEGWPDLKQFAKFWHALQKNHVNHVEFSPLISIDSNPFKIGFKKIKNIFIDRGNFWTYRFLILTAILKHHDTGESLHIHLYLSRFEISKYKWKHEINIKEIFLTLKDIDPTISVSRQ